MPKRKMTRREVSALTMEQLECRDDIHGWQTFGFYTTIGDKTQIIKRQICFRCTSQRLRWLKRTRNGVEVIATKIIYAEGYQLPGNGRVEKTKVRAEILKRVDIFSADDLEKDLQKPLVKR